MIPQHLYSLAPLTLRNHLRLRYAGDDMCLPMSAFAPADQQRIRDLYQFLGGLFDLFSTGAQCDEITLRRIAEYASEETIRAVVEEARLLGTEIAEGNLPELYAATVHDLRGGGLSLLLGRLQFAHHVGWTPETGRVIYYLARDQRKIFRNALLGLDDPERAIDLSPRLHSAGLIVEKWEDMLLVSGDRQLHLAIQAEFMGPVAACCTEFGALDRILYNLINNACRHTAESTIRLYIFPIPQEKPENLRFVLINRLHPADRERLAGRNLEELFRPGVSTTDSGLGLTVVTDFVGSAFGVLPRPRTTEGGYVGAKIIEEDFVAWFHWPIAREQGAP